MRLIIILLPLVMLAGCADWPDLSDRVDQTAAATPPPPLQPVAPLIAQGVAAEALLAMPGGIETEQAERIAALAARTEALRAPALTPEERERMLRGVDRSALQ